MFSVSGVVSTEHLPVVDQQSFEFVDRHFESEAIAILRIADGTVAELRGTEDRLGMLTPLGILPDIG